MVQKAIELKDLTLSYNKNWKLSVGSMEVAPSSIVAFSGPNGSGKSTLLRSIALLLKPVTGQITVFGKSAYLSKKSDRLLRKRFITMVHQTPYLFRGTVKENIMLGLKSTGKIKDYPKAKRLLKSLEKEEIENKKADQLSGGQKQKVALIRAMIMPVKILIFDEPLESLDETSRTVFLNLCQKMASEDKTILISSHRTHEILKIAGTIYNLSDGKLFPGNPKNSFKGKLVEKDGFTYFDTGKLIFAAPYKPDASVALIEPEAISISLNKHHSSIRNCLPGKIIKMIHENELVSIAVDTGETFWATITDYSARRLKLSPGKDIYLNFKASSVKLF